MFSILLYQNLGKSLPNPLQMFNKKLIQPKNPTAYLTIRQHWQQV